MSNYRYRSRRSDEALREHLVRLARENQEWALDFAYNVLSAGRNIRVLSVVDAFTRECLVLEVDTGFASQESGIVRRYARRCLHFK